MNITFLGASGEVTGSCYLLQTARARILIDCGMFQGSVTADLKNRRPFPFRPADLDAVVLSHAHLDHCGRLPLLVSQGYARQIVCTPTTIPLTTLILNDAAHLQSEDAQRMDRRRTRRGSAPTTPLFLPADAEAALARLSPLPYSQPREIAPGITLTFHDAGHILGSATLTLEVTEGGQTKTIVFSADLGELNTPIIHDPERLAHADAVILESTYGDRDHQPLDQTVAAFKDIIRSAESGGGKILIPAFAIGRTQTLIYHLAEMQRSGELKSLPVFLDSPMAISATKLYDSHKELFDDESRALLTSGMDPLRLPQLKCTVTSDESRAINERRGPAIIIAGSGMATGGRILHHFRHNLFKSDTHVLIVGFQAEGTLGRRLVDGEPVVRIFGEPIAVRARIHTLGGFSAHAGQTTLMQWFQTLAPQRPKLFLTHGEPVPRVKLAEKIKSTYGLDAIMPQYQDRHDL
ncbi:MBL fold metallo-hydrolase [soil metagenome]